MLKKLGLARKIACKYNHVTDSNHRIQTARNLLDRQFAVTWANKLWRKDLIFKRFVYFLLFKTSQVIFYFISYKSAICFYFECVCCTG